MFHLLEGQKREQSGDNNADKGVREVANRLCIQISTLIIYAPDFHGKHSKIFLPHIKEDLSK